MEIGFLSRTSQLQKQHNKDTKQFVSLLSAGDALRPATVPSDFCKAKGNVDTVPLLRKYCVLIHCNHVVSEARIFSS